MPTASMRLGAVLSAALMAALVPGPAQGAGRATTCTPAQRDEAISEISLDETQVAAFDEVQAYFQGRLPIDACAGDTVVLGVPAALRVQSGMFSIGDPEGVPIGTMRVSSTRRSAVLTFNDYVSTHEQVSFYGYLTTTVTPSLAPGSRHDVRWSVGSRSFSTPVTTQTCPRCDRPRTRARSWATLEGNVVTFALESRPTRRRGEKVVFVERLAPGQAVRCSSVRAQRAHVGRWGQLVPDGRARLRVTNCGKDRGRPGGTLIRAQVTGRAPRQHLVLTGTALVRDPTLPRLTDVGVVVQRGRRDGVSRPAAGPSTGSAVGGTGRLPTPSPSVPTPPASAPPGADGPNRVDVERGGSDGLDRTPILLSGLTTFVLGALLVTVGLRRRR